MMPWTVTLFIVAPLAGGMVNRIGERPLVVGGLILQAIGFAWIALIATPGLVYGALVLPLIVAGCGVSMAMPAAQNAVLGALPRSALGTASGAFNTLRQLGGTFGIAIIAVVFTAAGSYASPHAFTNGFVPAMGVAAALSLAAALAGWWIPERQAAFETLAAPGDARTPMEGTTVAGA
jgi:MFS family permease